MNTEELKKQLEHMKDCPLCNAIPDDPYGVCPIYTQMEDQSELEGC